MKKQLAASLLAFGATAALPCLQPETASASTIERTLTSKTIYLNGKSVENVKGFVAGGTTYMPIWYVMQVLEKLGLHTAWNGTTWSISTPMQPDFTSLQVGRGRQGIALNGVLIHHLNGIAYRDAYCNTQTEYMPIWYVMQSLNRLQITSGWDGTHWHLTTKATPAHGTTVSTSVPRSPFEDVDLRFPAPSAVTATSIDEWLASKNAPLQGLGATYMLAQQRFGVTATYLLGHSILETGWGTSVLANTKNNLYGYGAYDSNPNTYGGVFPSQEYAILYQAWFVRNHYLNPDAQYFYQNATVDGMNHYYATDPEWAPKIGSLMNTYSQSVGQSAADYTEWNSQNTPADPADSSEPEFLMVGASGVAASNPYTDTLPVFDQFLDTNSPSRWSGSQNGVVSQLPVGVNVSVDAMMQGMADGVVTEWYHVNSPGYRSGWVDSKFVQLTNVYRLKPVSGYNVNVYDPVSHALLTSLHTGDAVVSNAPAPDATGQITIQFVNLTTGEPVTGVADATDTTLSPWT